MAIKWPDRRRASVKKILAAYPKESARCELAAKEIFPHAHSQDANAATWRITPRSDGLLPFLVLSPKVSVGGDRWHYHIAVEAESHCVDALTQVDGTETHKYLETHFNYPEVLSMIKISDPE